MYDTRTMPTLVAQRYRRGDAVPLSGMYVCVPCGYVQSFEAGAAFTECLACLAGTEFGPEGYREGEQEFWELMV